jgi:hypothetical protein
MFYLVLLFQHAARVQANVSLDGFPSSSLLDSAKIGADFKLPLKNINYERIGTFKFGLT